MTTTMTKLEMLVSPFRCDLWEAIELEREEDCRRSFPAIFWCERLHPVINRSLYCDNVVNAQHINSVRMMAVQKQTIIMYTYMSTCDVLGTQIPIHL